MSQTDSILAALYSGATVLTANQRAARYLRQQWDQAHRNSGDLVWPTANVQTWDDWCLDRWTDLLILGSDDRLLLSPLQEHTVWQETIDLLQKRQQLRRGPVSLQSTQSLAQQAASANALLDEYCSADLFSRHAGNQSVDAFRLWRCAFLERCEKERLLPASLLENVLAAAFDSRTLLPSQQIVLVGFDLFTPAQSLLLASLKSAGCNYVIEQTAPQPSTDSQWFSYPTPRDELHAAALWARQQLQQRPSSRVAIILPDGDARRTEIDRIFRAVLALDQIDIAVGNRSLPYEFSLGLPISRHPMTAAALSLLRWCVQPLPLEEAASLLRSTWLCHTLKDQHLSINFEMQYLRRTANLLPEIELDDIYHLAQRHNAASLLSRFETLRKHLTLPEGAMHTHSEWAARIHTALHESGWPGASSLDSAEYQLFERWKRLLDDFSQLDFRRARISLKTAIAQLQFIAEQNPFAPESQDAPVQILGVLESAGSRFDAIWFAGVTALAWPPPGETHPLLPWSLQRDLQMPHSDPAAEYALALTIQNRISASASIVVFSHHREDADGAQLPSPLLLDSGLTENNQLADSLPPFFPPHSLPMEQTDALGHLPPPRDTVLTGGANLLRSQSLCPFRAFAEHRLHSASPEPIEFGVDARDSGITVHRILERFWIEVRSHAALVAMSAENREKKLRTLASQELHRIINPNSQWEKSALNIQLDSLVHLLLQWLEVEAQRPPFTVVVAEHPIDNAKIGPLHLSLRCDRIDNVDGGEVLIDYKTGKCSPADWDGNRPNEPQLPLYAVAREPGSLRAIAFARVRPGELNLSGIQSQAGIIRPVKLKKNNTLAKENKVVDLAQRLAEWQITLTDLANNFHHGTPRVDPKHKYQTCEYCQQSLLCRVAEIRSQHDQDEEIVDDSPEADDE
jgi:probable DNA repair protein